MKVMVVAHGHPALSPGGGERAAYSLFEHLKGTEGIDPVFVARADPADIAHDAWFSSFRGKPDEILWETPAYDWFRRTSEKPDILRLHAQALIDRFQPDVVHFHHYIFFGVDAIGAFRDLARCRTVLTLHEYALICHHDGQMVKTRTFRPCHVSSPAECHACFPERPAAQFFARGHLLRHLLDRADALISPSAFLRDRHVAWGIPQDRITVIENLLPPAFERAIAPPQAASDRASTRVRLGFFGTLNRYKGAPLLLDAIRHLPPEISARLELVLFGAKLEDQPDEFQQIVKKGIADSTAKVSLFGPYENREVARLMRGVDWLVVPSTWWENSPVVIQEALAVGTPILASNIGGMAEKVRDGIDGLHFLAGSPADLAERIEAIVSGRVTLQPTPVNVVDRNRQVLDAHLRLYGVPGV